VELGAALTHDDVARFDPGRHTSSRQGVWLLSRDRYGYYHQLFCVP
jgi:hypothetical protein